MASNLKRAIDTDLSCLCTTERERAIILRNALEGKKVKKKLSIGLALAIILLLLAGVAFALTFSDVFFRQAAILQNEKGDLGTWSLKEKIALIGTMEESGIAFPADKYEVLLRNNLSGEEANRLANEILIEAKVSREALVEKFGFSNETFAFFSRTISFSKSEDSAASLWIVTYTPKQFAERVGTYEVRVFAATGEVQSTDWSLASAAKTALKPNNWSAEIWNPQLIDRLTTFQQAYEQKRAAMEAQLGDYVSWSIADKAALDQIYVDGQYPLGDQVINILPDSKDVTEADAVQFATDCITTKYAIDSAALNQYSKRESFLKIPGHEEKLWIIEFWKYEGTEDENYIVEFRSPSKRVQLCQLYKSGIALASETESVTREASPTPASASISKDQACKTAWDEMKSKYGFEEIVSCYFNVRAEETDNPSMWNIFFTSNSYNPSKVGTYCICVDRIKGDVVSTAWDLEVEYRKQGPCEPWRSAELWSANEYNQYAQLRQAAKAIIAQAGDQWSLSFEQQAQYDGLYRQAGYDRTEYYHGLPGEFDLSQNEATQIAKDAVSKKYKIDHNLVDQSVITHEFDVSDETLYQWRIRILVMGESEMMYAIEIDPRTGKILKMTAQPGSNG